MPVAPPLSTTRWEPPLATGAAVLLPGFLDGRHGEGQVAMGTALCQSGFTTLAVDPRGTWSSPGTTADLGPTTQLADIAALVDELAPGRLVLVGHCYGALLACLAAERDARVTDVVALMPSRCFIWPQDHRPGRDARWRRDGVRTFRRERDGVPRDYPVPYSVVADALRHDLAAAVARLRQRALFVAGEQDKLIGVEPVERLFDECGSPRKELAVLPVQHDYRDRPDEIALVNRTVTDWLAVRDWDRSPAG